MSTTPGRPWTASAGWRSSICDASENYRRVESAGDAIAICPRPASIDDPAESDAAAISHANLIAAAPEEHESLKVLVRETESFVNLAMGGRSDLREDAPRSIRNALATARAAIAKAEGR